jgi:5-methylcytosine-specific restriction endonuclease McrA
MPIEAILFASAFTAVIGYPYWKLTRLSGASAEYVDDHEPTSQEIRESPEYRAWRNSVVRRDGFQCIWCHATNNLEAHHIYSFASFPEGRFDIKNGITLCRDCHKLTPNYGSKEKAFSEQLKSRI